MDNNKLNFYFFGDIGEYDCYNPAHACGEKFAPEILWLIASNEPFSISRDEIAGTLNADAETIEDVTCNLQLIDAIEARDNGFRIKFPTFLEKDVVEMEKYVSNAGEIIGKKVMSLRDMLYEQLAKLQCSKQHSKERILYHVICDRIFDGTAFEFFAERDVFCTSKLQPGNRDYMIVAYEDSEAVEKHSNKLLCSSNNYRSGGFTFNSFGDLNGSRKDMYRFFRLMQKSVDGGSPFYELNVAYNPLLDNINKKIAYECGELMQKLMRKGINHDQLTEKEKSMAKFLKEMGYVDVGGIHSTLFVKVPTFYEFEEDTVIKEMSDMVLENIFPTMKDIFDNFYTDACGSTSARHGVDMKETANELWHQIFGAANEYMAREGFVATPSYVAGEGRYLQSVTLRSSRGGYRE